MIRRIYPFITIAVLVLSSLACQAVTRVIQPTPTTGLLSVAQSHPLQATPTPVPTATITFTPSATATQPPPTLTPTLSPTPTLIPTPSEAQFRIFERLWELVKDEYVYPDFNGLDWDGIYDEFSALVQGGLTDLNFYLAMDEMILRLGDEHSVYLSPQQVAEETAEFAGENDYVGIGVITSPVPERERVTVIAVFPGSPAEEAGLRIHDNILAVDGEPIFDEDGARRSLLRGPEDTSMLLTIQTPGEEPRQVEVFRRRVTGAAPVPYEVLETASGKRVGYILVTTFADDTVDDQIEDALRAMQSQAALDGLILDNRQNTGGADNVTRNTLSYFTGGNQGYFTDRRNRRRGFNVIGGDVAGSAEIPLVVMVGQNTVSFGEIFSGVLKDSGRAHLVGEVTEGNIELLWGYDFEDGSRVWLARETFRPRFHPEENWEDTGIVPDQIVPSNWDEVTTLTDPAIHAALDYFESQ